MTVKVEAPPRTWRVFCEYCDWREEGLRDRDRAVFEGRTHARTAHPDEDWGFRVQGLAVTRSWTVYGNEERSDDDANVNTALEILRITHALDAVPFKADEELDTNVWMHLQVCRQALDMLAERAGLGVGALLVGTGTSHAP